MEPVDYKATLNLPRTDFPMKASLPQREPETLKKWEEQGTYRKLLAQNAGRELFVFHDGPPYANGHIHQGHILNKVLKDMVVKYWNLAGRLAEFVPGWDCHGLPIELQVDAKLKDKKRSMSKVEIRQECRKHANEFMGIQRDEFKRLGVFARWDEPYLTMSFDYEAQTVRELARFAARGALYRGKKPVHWCINDRTALAEAEVEYEDHESPSIYVAFPAEGDLSRLGKALSGRKVAFAIWTTTPWTLPANLAIAVHPEFSYLAYDLKGRVVIVAKELLARFLADVAPEELAMGEVKDPSKILAHMSGKDLDGLKYRHPFLDRVSPVLFGEHVTLEAGTGLVHTAPGHGQEDYEVGKAHGLPILAPVDAAGCFTAEAGELAGKKVWDANPLIVDKLVEKGALLNEKGQKLKHSYPHCWRCKKPVIFRATDQWFISMQTNDLRKKALEEVDRVRWIPRWGRERIHGMLENRPDWCVSRQRTWGVPIPVFYCEKCEEPLVSPKAMETVAGFFEKEGADAWFTHEAKDFLPKGQACGKCGHGSFRKESDILDVWFDSGVSYAAVAEKRPNMRVPVDLYLEGSDQHRGWFHSSLLCAVGTRDKAPYKAVLTHGFVVDGQGRKMSKSLGNYVDPEKTLKQYGAEIFRLWVAAEDYRDDIRLSDEILKGLAEGYRKIRNTLRYCASNLFDFDPEKDLVAPEKLPAVDRWAYAKLQALTQRVRKAYEDYEFHVVYHSVLDFCAVDLSAIYFDVSKDRLYTFKAGSPERRAAQTVLYLAAMDLLRLLAPVMSFTMEEAYGYLPGKKKESVFLTGLPEPKVQASDAALFEHFDRLLAVRSEVSRVLEAARRDKLIGSSLEARVVLHATGAVKELLAGARDELASFFIVSEVELAAAPPAGAQKCEALPELLIKVEKARGEKCPRCWTYSEQISPTHPVCTKCERALKP